MKKRLLAGLLSMVMLLTVLPTAAFAADEDPGELPPVENCNCTAPCTEDNRDPDCPVCGGPGGFAACAYTEMLPENGSAADTDLAPRAETTYEISDENYTEVLQEATDSSETDITFVLTGTVTTSFAGISGKHITLTSQGDSPWSINLASELVGDITLDNVEVSGARTLYACGHTFETTVNFEDSISTLYGGGPENMDVEGGTSIIIRGGSVGTLYGGGHDSNVTGDVSILIDCPATENNNTVGSLYGGGYADDTVNGKVFGDVTVTMLQGSNGTFFGGGNNAYATADNEGDREPASVSGTVTVNFGYDGAPDKTVWPGRAMYMCAGSVHSTVGNTVLNIMDGFTSENDGGDRNVFGCGYNDTVLGTVQINISGSPDIGNSFIYGGGNSISHPEEWPVRILNQRQEEYALRVTYDVPQELTAENLKDVDRGINAGSKTSLPTTIEGNVLVEVESGNLAFTVLDNENFKDDCCEISGNSEILIHSGRVAQVQGNKIEYQSDETDYTTTVSLDGEDIEIGYFYYFDEVALNENAGVVVDATKFSQFETATQKPFYSVDGLVIDDGACLTTQNNGQARILSYVELQGTWEQKYVSGDALTDDVSRAGADLRVGGSMTVNGGTLISHGTAHIYNDLEATGGTLVFMKPSIISMTGSSDRVFSVDGTDIYLPVIENTGFYPAAGQIPLAVGEKATGTADVYLFSGDDYKTQADITDTNVGQNYINAQSEKSDAAFTLANDSAQSGGYYFKRVDDKKTFETLSYDMWQVAKDPTLTLRPEDQTIYSGGESGDTANPEFPHPIYVDRNGIPLDDDVTFKVDGAGWDDSTHEYPFTVKYYDKNGTEITDDQRYGDFTARIVPVDGVDADKITTGDGRKVEFEDGTLRIRYVSDYTDATANALTTDALEYTEADKERVKAKAEASGEAAVLLPESTTIYLNGKSSSLP